jgi:hypothetical protein
VLLRCSLVQPSSRNKSREGKKEDSFTIRDVLYDRYVYEIHVTSAKSLIICPSLTGRTRHSHPWKKTNGGDLGKEVDMLSLDTASRTCRLGVETAWTQTRQVATFVEVHFWSEQAQICRTTFARTDLGGKIVT